MNSRKRIKNTSIIVPILLLLLATMLAAVARLSATTFVVRYAQASLLIQNETFVTLTADDADFRTRFRGNRIPASTRTVSPAVGERRVRLALAALLFQAVAGFFVFQESGFAETTRNANVDASHLFSLILASRRTSAAAALVLGVFFALTNFFFDALACFFI